MSNCSVKLKVEKLPLIINKLEYFLFRALEMKGMDFYKISQQPKTPESIEVFQKIRNGEYTRQQLSDLVGGKLATMLVTASNADDINRIGKEAYRVAQMVHLFETVKTSIIPNLIADYIEKAAISKNEYNDESSEELYKKFAGNLQGIISLWDQITPNFLVYSDIFRVKSKFKLDEDGLIDMSTLADDDAAIAKMVFDQPANEIDPVDDIDKSVELFIRSIPSANTDLFDDYGYTMSVNYSDLIRKLFNDLENSTGLNEIISRLNKNKEKVPEYTYILNKLEQTGQNLTAEELNFRIKFRNSFVKAFVPIYITSIERQGDRNSFIITEAASGKSSAYERKISSNFSLRGIEVVADPAINEVIQLATQEDGVWMLMPNDMKKINNFLNATNITDFEKKRRKVEFLKGLGFEFSPKTEQYLTTSSYLKDSFGFIVRHLSQILENKPFVLNPIKDLQRNISNPKVVTGKLAGGQSAAIVRLIEEELKNNPEYNVEKSSISAEGTRVHALQLHNGFTVLAKYLSDPNLYEDIFSIIASEPSMFWLDPRKNPSIANSYFLNSLFFFNPLDDRFGKRRYVTKSGNEYVTKDEAEANGATPVSIGIINTGGLQMKLLDSFEKEGVSTTGLNEIDKLLLDIHAFGSNSKRHYTSVMRLGDKSTDLGITLNYGIDVSTGKPIKNGKPLGSNTSSDIFNTDAFNTSLLNALKDIVKVRYLYEKGFYKSQYDSNGNLIESGLLMANGAFYNKDKKPVFGLFDSLISEKNKKIISDIVKETAEDADGSIDDLDFIFDKEMNQKFLNELSKDFNNYFTKNANNLLNKLNTYKNKVGLSTNDIIYTGNKDINLKDVVYSYVANTFITDLDQMKVFFGDAIYFKDFHKRASKDSATGIFTFIDNNIIDHLNEWDNNQGLGGSNNLTGRRLIERLFLQGKITEEQRRQALQKQKLNKNKSYKSAVLKDVDFRSVHADKILENIEKISAVSGGYISPQMKDLYDKNLKKTIKDKYEGTEADGQGKCTFDFYRIMSILTGQWLDEQEEVYKKIVEYDHYDELADEETDPVAKAEYIRLRDAVGYDSTAPVYFPPKKFQYAGTQKYSRQIDGEEYNQKVPVFDKFSLQPLIPTVVKRDGIKTADYYLAKKMEFNGIGYVKFKSGSKVETPSELDEFYSEFDPKNPTVRKINKFNPTDKFKSEQELYFDSFKEQVAIHSEIHDHATFGSQIRKLILMNLDRPEFVEYRDKYIKYMDHLAQLEKTALYEEMGIKKVGSKLQVGDLNKLVEYFFKEIDKKNQDSNVKKALAYDESTGKFNVPLDAAVQAQVIEGIIISAINNRVVRYKTNGSMLVQMAITGSEPTIFNKDDSKKAVETYGNSELNYYDVQQIGDNVIVGKMDVKIALTGQWLNLLNLTWNGSKIGTRERLNQAIRDDAWRAENEKAITMIAYRIPTQGRNFLDVMMVKEFLPASVGDAIVMPSEVVIKSGSDFDIDKMFVFYPNLDKNGNYINFEYNDSILQENIQDKKAEAVADLSYLKLARRTTVNDLLQEFKDLERAYKKSLRKDTQTRDKLNRLLRRVQTIIAVMDAESADNMKTALTRTAENNDHPDSVLQNLIRSNITFDIGEYEKYMEDNNLNVFNPMLWVDTRKQGLETLINSIENLFNSEIEYLKLVRDQNKEYIDGIYNDITKEIEVVHERLYKYNNIKGNIQNKLYDVMADIILHPANYMELVTPSENYHILPIINKIFEKLGRKKEGEDRPKTDYKNSDILDREKNLRKFISLLKGKSDLGIAAKANTFNVMFQLANAKGNRDFFIRNNIKTFFNSDYIEKNSNGIIENIEFGSIFDEDNQLKSEFFSEFINAFVDVARDDYVFAANVVTELSPIIFYMKYAGMSSKKILYFVNQPAIRTYIKNLSMYQNLHTQLNIDENEGSRKLALRRTLLELGFSFEKVDKGSLEKKLSDNINLVNGPFDQFFTEDMLERGIQKGQDNGEVDFDISTLSNKGKVVQLSMLLELLNLREQSNSMTEAQRFLDFDTNPYKSSFEVYGKNKQYEDAVSQNTNVLDSQTLNTIKNNSVISPLDVGEDIKSILNELFPVRNDEDFNSYLLDVITEMKNNYANPKIVSNDDMSKVARTAKNDFATYLLQNGFDRSEEGTKFFKETFNTDKNLNEYLLELVTTTKMLDNWYEIKSRKETDDDGNQFLIFNSLAERFPFIKNIVLQRGENNNRLITFKLVENSSNPIEKQSVINQFEEIINIEPKNDTAKLIINFFKDLSLYSTFQSGMNTSDVSYTSVVPIEIVNKLYGYAFNSYQDLISNFDKKQKNDIYDHFWRMFILNNPSFFNNNTSDTLTGDKNSLGKWYTRNYKLDFKKSIESSIKAQPGNVMTPLGKQTRLVIKAGTFETKQAARRNEGIYSMRPNPGDAIPGVNENLHFGNPWSEKGFQGSIKTIQDGMDGIIEAANNYEKWLRKEDFFDVQPERRDWILGLIDSGRLDNKTFVYFKSGYRSHAHVLVELINERIKDKPGKSIRDESSPGLSEVKVFKWNRPSASRGTDADVAMREDARYFVGEVTDYEGNSSTHTSAKEILAKWKKELPNDSEGKPIDWIVQKTPNSKKTIYVFSNGGRGAVMLARNGSLKGQPLEEDTKFAIKKLHDAGDFTFIVGDMEGVDTPFIDYLNEIGATYSIYGHGRLPGISDKAMKRTKPADVVILKGKEGVDQFVTAIGGKKVSKGLLNIEGQFYYVPLGTGAGEMDIFPKPTGEDLFMYDKEENEIYIGSRKKGEKVFKVDPEFKYAFDKLSKTVLDYTSDEINELEKQLEGSKPAIKPTTPIAKPSGKGVKVISDDDVAAYITYLSKSNNVAPKEFFTSATKFKVFYNPVTGRRENAPQTSKWLLQDNGLYYLTDKESGEIYIEDVDLKTGVQYVSESKTAIKKTAGITKEQAIKEYGDDLIYGVNLRSKQDKIRQGDEETIFEAYNYLKAEEKAKNVREQNKKEKEELKTKIDNLKKRINVANQTKVGDVVSIYNDENVSQFKAKVKSIEFKEKTAVITVVTAKKKEYTYVVNEDGFSTKGSTEIENFSFKSSGENKQELLEEYNKLVKRYNSIKDYVDFADYWVDYSKTSSESKTEVKNEPVKTFEIEPGRYVKYQDEVYIITKFNKNKTVQIYNPLKEGTAAKKSVSQDNLQAMANKANIINYRNTDYIVTSKGIIISLDTNKAMKWGEENGMRKDILSLYKIGSITDYTKDSIEYTIASYLNNNLDDARVIFEKVNSVQDIQKKYDAEKLSGEKIEEFLKRLSC